MSDDLKILFTGDLSFTGVFRERVARHEEIFDGSLLELFARHDFTVVNLEGPVTTKANTCRPDINVVNPPNSIEYLASRNINIFNCANNHIFDSDVAGFTDTIQAIEGAGGRYFGAGANLAEATKPLHLSRMGRSVALFGICNHTNRIATSTDSGTFYDSSIAQIDRAIRAAKAEADYTILNYHAGEEYTTIPMPSRRRRMLKFAALGPDAIIGHHSHVMQGHERAGRCELFYSLGNFIFDVDYFKTKQYTDRSAIASLTFDKSGMKYQLIPVAMDLAQGRIMLGDATFLDHVRQISDFANYRTLWRRDAYRTVRQPGRKLPEVADAASNSLRRRKVWSNLFNLHWYRHQYRRLANPNQRPIVIAAFHEAIRKLVGK